MQGYLLTQNYQNGFFVKKGQLLFTIDPRPFVAALDQAKAQVAVAQANLGEAENNVARDTPLVAQNAIPKKQLDTDQSTLAANQAQLDAAKAQMVQAQLNLEWTKVYSPIDGIAGILEFAGRRSGGNHHQDDDYLPGQSNLGILQHQRERLPLQRASDYRGNHAEGAGTECRSTSNTSRPMETPIPEKGKIIFVNRQIATQTGTIQIAAAFPNKGAHPPPRRLWQSANPDRRDQGRVAGSAARRDRSAVAIPDHCAHA